MKNKEIEELLNELKDEDNYIEEYGFRYKRIALDDWWLLLSCIEQLENKAELGSHYKHLYSEVKKQKDDVVEYIKKQTKNMPENGCKYRLNNILRMLGEIDE